MIEQLKHNNDTMKKYMRKERMQRKKEKEREHNK